MTTGLVGDSTTQILKRTESGPSRGRAGGVGAGRQHHRYRERPVGGFTGGGVASAGRRGRVPMITTRGRRSDRHTRPTAEQLVIALRDVVKQYRMGDTDVQALQGCLSTSAGVTSWPSWAPRDRASRRS